MTITSFTRFLAVASLSLFAGLTIQQQSVSAATSTVGVTFSGIIPEMQAKAAEERAAEEEVNDAWLDMDFTDDSPVEVEETVNGQTQHYWEYADGTTSQTAAQPTAEAAPAVSEQQTPEAATTTTKQTATPVKKAQPKKEKFKPMPSVATIKQLTFDWASAQVMQSLEKMIAHAIKGL
ncbi:hypothetical protein [Latilactobacillus sakei]|uniref:hypothetical protein n=1 Tax=Latilactobacillus sakei TaxID=1599 RepID=UPI000C1284AA|nr:hypothetical protein [Latilactobacillus sakei]PKX61491.1 hypothetical protein CUR39_03770 [Latilactobacillus sakei]PKX70250.1 hypothetical protein CUR36_04410 [Latilactobacillus sakei]RFN57271.1 hypothetical protein DT321_00265 [Latilactobacillus sakei]UNC16944.1 hypothetical protein FX990_01515 [Latilactobacillus sakei]SON69918.1 conserved exported protein of unknown function [Latilactobacillus sakei]